jgi:hypothetical protein
LDGRPDGIENQIDSGKPFDGRYPPPGPGTRMFEPAGLGQ